MVLIHFAALSNEGERSTSTRCNPNTLTPRNGSWLMYPLANYNYRKQERISGLSKRGLQVGQWRNLRHLICNMYKNIKLIYMCRSICKG